MAGIVSERLRSSSIRDSQLTLDLLPAALGSTTTEERKLETPPSRAMLLVEMWLVVLGAACTTLAPVSRSCPAPAKVMPVNSMRAPSPCSTLIGYRQPVWEPKEPDTHSIVPPFSTRARLVFRLYMFLDQFSIVE